MMNEKMVSAIITTCKREPKIIDRAIRSVLNQTYKIMEIIIVDDSPNSYEQRGKVKELVESYFDCSVKYIAHENNMGACVARNTGMVAASGEFVAFLDDDDEWLPEKIEKQLACFDDDIGLVYCGRKFINDDTNTIEVIKRIYYEGMIYSSLIKENYIGSTSFPLIRKSVLEAVGGFDPNMKSAQDYDVWLRIARTHRITYVEEPLVLYHVYNGERISTNNEKIIRGLELLNEKNLDYLQEHKDIWASRIMQIVPYYAANNQKRKAIITWIKAVCMNPYEVKKNIWFLSRIFLV